MSRGLIPVFERQVAGVSYIEDPHDLIDLINTDLDNIASELGITPLAEFYSKFNKVNVEESIDDIVEGNVSQTANNDLCLEIFYPINTALTVIDQLIEYIKSHKEKITITSPEWAIKDLTNLREVLVAANQPSNRFYLFRI